MISTDLWYGPTVAAQNAATENEWMEINGKLYCPDCYEYDEELGDYVVKKREKNEKGF